MNQQDKIEILAALLYLQGAEDEERFAIRLHGPMATKKHVERLDAFAEDCADKAVRALDRMSRTGAVRGGRPEVTPDKRAYLKEVADQRAADNLREASKTRDRLLRAYKMAHKEFALAFQHAKERLGVDGAHAVLNRRGRRRNGRSGRDHQRRGARGGRHLHGTARCVPNQREERGQDLGQ